MTIRLSGVKQVTYVVTIDGNDNSYDTRAQATYALREWVDDITRSADGETFEVHVDEQMVWTGPHFRPDSDEYPYCVEDATHDEDLCRVFMHPGEHDGDDDNVCTNDDPHDNDDCIERSTNDGQDEDEDTSYSVPAPDGPDDNAPLSVAMHAATYIDQQWRNVDGRSLTSDERQNITAQVTNLLTIKRLNEQQVTR